MSSIFDLKQSASELPSLNSGLAKLTYTQVPSTRDVTGTNFPGGAQHYRWQTAGVRWWIPSRTYVRMRGRLLKADGVTQVVIGDDVAPNMGLMAALYQSAEFRMGGKTIARVSDFMPQVDALQKRTQKSKSWLDGVGKDLEYWEPDFYQRQAEVTSDGYYTDEKAQFVPPTAATRLAMGFDPLTTIEIVAATSRAVFAAAAGAAPDIINLQPIHVGDVITLANAVRYSVTRIVSALIAEVTVLNLPTILNDAAAADAFTVERVQDYQEQKSFNRSGLEVIWQPPLSIWGVSHGMPAGEYELVLNPQNSAVFEKRAIESLVGDQNAPGDFRFIVDDLFVYLATAEGPSVDNLSYFMSLEEVRCQVDQIDANTSLQQKNFDVSPAAYALTVAFQDVDANVDTRRSGSKYKIRQIVGFEDEYPSAELALQRMFVRYNGEQKPSPDADPNFLSPDGFMKSRYAETLLYSGAYFDCGGGESFRDWVDRGPYYYFSYPKDGSSESTRVNVNYQFRRSLGATGRVLLFDHYRSMVLVSIVNGRIQDVVVQEG